MWQDVGGAVAAAPSLSSAPAAAIRFAADYTVVDGYANLTPAPLDELVFETVAGMADVGNHKIVVPETGVYHLAAHVFTRTDGMGDAAILRVFVNGADPSSMAARRYGNWEAVGVNSSHQVGGIAYLQAGDEVTMALNVRNTVDVVLRGGNSGFSTVLSVARMGSSAVAIPDLTASGYKRYHTQSVDITGIDADVTWGTSGRTTMASFQTDHPFASAYPEQVNLWVRIAHPSTGSVGFGQVWFPQMWVDAGATVIAYGSPTVHTHNSSSFAPDVPFRANSVDTALASGADITLDAAKLANIGATYQLTTLGGYIVWREA